MKKAAVKIRVAVAAVLLAILLISVVGIGGRWGLYASGQSVDPGDHTVVRDALRRGGLREAARVKGRYVADLDPHWDFGLFDIEALTKGSVAVVVGIASKKVDARLSSNGHLIFTDYEVEVIERIKGPSSHGSRITVSLPGGFFEFEEGTSAELRTPDFEHLKVGASYILFLSDSEKGYNVYTLSGGPQGVIEIVNGKTLKSHGRPTDPVSEETKDNNKDRFLEKVRDKAAKWPLPGKCCG
jgi:hypothetical protein